MSIEYKLLATDILDILSNIPKKKYVNEKLRFIETKYDIVLPHIFKQFMRSSNKMLKTADVWNYSEERSWYFLYEWINITIEETEKISSDSEYFSFVHSPISEWNNLVDDYMIIGSDYAAGIVYFGIKKTDLNMKNPPVYMYHEANHITEWNLMFNHLSDYFLTVVCDAILCECYNTAQKILIKYNWNYEVYDTGLKEILNKYGIETDNLQKLSSMYQTSDDDWISCCYDSEEKVLFVFKNSENNMKICVILKSK